MIETIFKVLSLPMVFADWIYSWTLQPVDAWFSTVSPFTKVYIALFVVYYYLLHLINKTRNQFFEILTKEQKEEFLNNTRRNFFGPPTFWEYVSGCWYGLGCLWIIYFIYKYLIMFLAYLFM